MVQYDPGIIRKFADKLYSYANGIILLFTLAGTIGGVLAGSALSAGARTDDARLTIWAITVGLGLLLGLAIGLQRAFIYKLQAQMALCQMMIEQNTRKATYPSAPTPGTFPVIIE